MSSIDWEKMKMEVDFERFVKEYLNTPAYERLHEMTTYDTSSSVTSSSFYTTYKNYNDYVQLYTRGHMGPSPKKENKLPKKTKFHFDPTGMNEPWKKPKK